MYRVILRVVKKKIIKKLECYDNFYFNLIVIMFGKIMLCF